MTNDDLHRDFGRMEGRLSALETRLEKMEAVLERIDSRLAKIEARESERKGILWAIAALGGILGTLGGLISRLFH